MTKAELEDLVRPIAAEEGVELVECQVGRTARSQTFRVFIDRDGGVPVDVCAHVSHRIARVLDASPVLRGGYEIEVSSPGMNRRVWTLDHFRRFAGEKVRVDLRPGAEPLVLTGEIGPVEGDGFWLTLEAGGRRLLRLEEIDVAHLRMDPWKRKPGGAPR